MKQVVFDVFRYLTHNIIAKSAEIGGRKMKKAPDKASVQPTRSESWPGWVLPQMQDVNDLSRTYQRESLSSDAKAGHQEFVGPATPFLAKHQKGQDQKGNAKH